MQQDTVEPLNDNRRALEKERTLAGVVTGGPDDSSTNIFQQITTGRLVQWTLCLNSNGVKHKLMG